MSGLARSARPPEGSPPKVESGAPSRHVRQSPTSRHLALNLDPAGGRPLEPAVRERAQASLGSAVGAARIHTDAAADRLAREQRAAAVTIGDQIAFSAGLYRPGTRAGDLLLGHELAHVAQAQRAPAAAEWAGSNAQPAEAEADIAAPFVLSGRPVGLATRPRSRVLRKSMADAPAKDLTALSTPSTAIDVSEFPLDDYFKVMSSGRFSMMEMPPENLTVELSGIEDAYKTPMTSVAMKLAGSTYSSPSTGTNLPIFGAGQTLMVHLPLKKYGLVDGSYRFTWTGSTAKGTLYIELASGAPADQNTLTAKTPAAGGNAEKEVAAGKDAPSGTKITVGSLTFSLASEWSAGQFAHLKRALTLIPESALKVVDGMGFEIGSSGQRAGEDGHYDEDTHRVVMFPSAWSANAARYGGYVWAVYAIAHEIGHAVDRAKIREAWNTYQGSQGGAAAEKKLTEARSESGLRYVKSGKDFNQEVPLKGTDGGFRTAATKDGVKVPKGSTTLTGGPSEYSNADWEEMYAESFAIYITDPSLLERLRPAIYAYFTGKYPRK